MVGSVWLLVCVVLLAVLPGRLYWDSFTETSNSENKLDTGEENEEPEDLNILPKLG